MREGNSSVIYRTYPSTTQVAGNIEAIEDIEDHVRFHVRRNLELPRDLIDPFCRYPHFSATTYSSHQSAVLDVVDLEDIVSHAAKFDFSEERTVFLNLSRD